MKRLNHLWSQITTFDNLYLAWRKAQRGKKRKDAVAEFGINLETELLNLQSELREHRYQPGEYHLFTIYERKARVIAAAPFRDRVVHHALLNLVEPPLDKRFIFDSYACRKGKGVHKAVDRYQKWAKSYRYALKMDIRQYFPSIDHALLKQALRKRIKDPDVLWLFDLLINTAPIVQREPAWFAGDDLLTPVERRTGLPIGNLTSQFLANLYLDEFDHFMKETLRLPAYLRYVDDMIVLADDKTYLHDIKQQVREKLAAFRLRLHPRKAHIVPVSDGLDVLGYRVKPYSRRLRRDNILDFNRRLRGFAQAYAQQRLDWQDFNPSVQSWLAHAAHADTLGLREQLFSATVFSRQVAASASLVTRRVLEQQSVQPALGEP